MTKQHYFEMCELLNKPPKPEDIPVELEDFPDEVQLGFSIYYVLQDQWEGISGTYMGKNWTGLMDIFDIYEVEKQDRKTIFEILHLIDRERSAQIELVKKQQEQTKSPSR